MIRRLLLILVCTCLAPLMALSFQQANPVNLNFNEGSVSSPATTLSTTDSTSRLVTWGLNTSPGFGSVSFTPWGSNNANCYIYYTPPTNWFGSTSFIMQASVSSTFVFPTTYPAELRTITVNVTIANVNDPPTFTLGANQTVSEDAAAQSIAGWATGFDPDGPGFAYESNSLLSYIVSNDSPDLFSVQPAVSASGTLTYTPAANRAGTATVTIQVRDNGGTANGGIDTSTAQQFTITINPVSDGRLYATQAGGGNGLSWASPFTLRQAMAYSTSGEDIWVAQGTHIPGSLRTDSFNLRSGVNVYGGFTGSETLLSQRNARVNVTTMSGDIQSDNDVTNNSYAVVTPSGNGTLDGFIISGGYANGGAGEGGGMYIDGKSPTIRNCVFSGNASPGFTGGAVSIRSYSGAASPLFSSVVFINNSAVYGGAVYTLSGGTFENCLFVSNSATTEGGAIRTSSGGSPSWTHCTFSGNTAPGSSAAIHPYGSATLTNCIIWSNTPASLVGGSGTITNCLVQGALPGSGYTITGTISSDPLFTNTADADGADNQWGTGDDGYFPQSTSPARDVSGATSSLTTDLRGSTRPSGNGYDLGCYERRVIYVHGSGGAGTGASWASTTNDLRGALSGSTASDEVWVRGGTYTLSTPVTNAFAVPAGVGLYGGFAGTETLRDSRDWTANRVTLNANGNYHALTAAGTGGVIDGFIVTGGNATGSYGGIDSGGGGLALNNASPTVRNCIFQLNAASYAGGAIFCQNNSSPRIENCLFLSNSAAYGGAIEAENGASAPVIINCTFVGNTASIFGTAFETASLSASPAVINCIMWGNGAGNAIYANGGSLPIVTNSLVQGSGGSSSWAGGTWGTNGGNNKDADPQFYAQGDPDGADNLFFTTDDGLLLLTGSPAANAGTMASSPTPPSLDIRRAARPLGSAADMGCYEGQIGRVAFVSSASAVSEGSASTNISVSLAAAADYPLSVPYTVTGGTATREVSITPAGSATSAVLPLYSYNQNWRTSYVYLASELGGAATWRSISLNVISALSGSLDQLTIRIRHSSKTDYATADWGDGTGWDTVYQGSAVSAPIGLRTFTFNQGDNQFVYNGTSNIEVDFIVRSAVPLNSYAFVSCIQPAVTRTIYGGANDGSGYSNDPTAWVGTGGGTNYPPVNSYPYIPIIRFSSAIGGPDYTLANGTLVFNPGVTSLSIPVTIIGDTVDEDNETVIVGLSTPTNGVLGSTTSHTLTINDDDAAPTVQWSTASSSGAESVANPTVTAVLSAQSARIVSVNYAYTGGTARNSTPQRDVTVTAATLTFSPGVTTATIPGGNFSVNSVPIFDEDDETVQIGLSTPSNASLGATTTHTYTIIDSDTSDVVVAPSSIAVTEGVVTAQQIDVVLATRPYSPPASDALVEVDFGLTDNTEIEISVDGVTWSDTASLWFYSSPLNSGTGLDAANAADWNDSTPPKLYVRSLQDSIDDGSVASSITVTVNASSGDARYKGLGVEYIAVTCHDDADAAGLSIGPDQSTPPGGVPPVPLSENWYPSLYLFADSSADNQTIHFSTSVAAVKPGMVAYSYWTGDIRFVQSVNVGTSEITLNSPLPGGFSSSNFAFGFENYLRVRLTSEPVGDVFVNVNSDAPGSVFLGMYDGNRLDSSNWQTGVKVWLSPNNNSIDAADLIATVTVSLSSTTDPNYASVGTDSETCIIYDDDVAGVTLSTTALSVLEGGTSNSYSMSLNSEPTGNVTITPSVTGGQATFSPPTLTFTPSNWYVSQSVQVTAVDDLDYDPGATSTITHAASGGGYGAVSVASVVVTADDNESNMPIVSPKSGLVTGEDGTQASFTVQLAARPGATEVISIPLSISTLSPNTEAEFFLGGTPSSTATIYFKRVGTGTGTGYSSADARTWNSPITVTLRGVQDTDTDGDQSFTVITGTTVSSLGGSSLLDGALVDDVTCTNVDDEAAGVKVLNGSVAVTEGGAAGTYQLQLTFDPADIVNGSFNVVEVSLSTSSADIQVSPSSVVWYGTEGSATFTGTRTITVTGLNDDIDEALEVAAIDHAVTATTLDVGSANLTTPATALYPLSLPIQDAQALVTDSASDVAGVNVFSPSTLSTTEAGGTATFSVTLKTQPTSAVTIQLTLGGNASEVRMTTVAEPAQTAAKTLSFDSTNWNTPQVVNVIGQPDSIDDGDKSFTVLTGATTSTDPFYSNLTVPDLPGVNTDINAVGVILSKSTVSVTEAGGTDTYKITLTSQPTATVTVTPNGDGQVSFRVNATAVTGVVLAAAASGDGSGRDTANAALWSNGSTVTVVALDDQIDEAASHAATITHSASGGDYSAVPIGNVTATITDRPTVIAGVTVTPPASFAIAEASGSDSVSVVLNSKPTGNVIIALASSDTTTAILSTSSLSFTPLNWNTPQSFTVTGVNDDIDQDSDGNQGNDSRSFSVSYSVTSFDGNYDGLAVSSTGGSATDDDVAGVTISLPSGGVVVSEAGATSTFTVVLNKRPIDTVTIPLSVSNGLRGSLSASSLVFTSANWNTPQTVTVTGLDLDGVNDAPGTTFTVQTLDPTGSATGSAFDRLTAGDVADVTVTIGAANAVPRYGSTSNITITESAGLTSVVIEDVDSGQDDEVQTMTIDVTSSNPTLIPSATATFAGAPAMPTDLPVDATIQFTPAPFQSGTAVLTVTITDDTTIATDPVAKSTVLTITVTVNAVNDAPIVTLGGGIPTFVEDGSAVAVLPSLNVSDVDNSTLSSATVTLTNPLDGASEYLTAATTGTSIIASYDANTGVLSLNAVVPQPLVIFQQVLRTVAYGNNNNNPTTGTNRSIQVEVNDGLAGSSVVAASVALQATNDSPVLSGTAVDLTAIAEDVVSGSNGGISVDALIGGGVVISDPDSIARGIAISATTASLSGTWQYSVGGPWIDFPNLGSGVHFILMADGGGVNRIRFAPQADQNGSASVTWRAWDQSDALGNAGTPTITGSGTAPSAYSAGTLTASLTVTPVNDAPILSAGGSMADVSEDSATHSGDSVSDLVAGAITDIDSGALSGIAVIGAQTANGTWQYTLDGGTNWFAFASLADASATVLAVNGAQTRVRFLPSADFNGTATFTYRAWDRTNGSSSGDVSVNASVNGGTTAFSSSSHFAVVTVDPVNDAPVLSGISGSSTVATIAEDLPDASNNGVTITTILGNLSTNDADTGSAAVGLAIIAADQTSGTWDYDAGSGWTPLTAVALNDASARLLLSGGLNRVRFRPDPNFTGSASLTVRAWDSTTGSDGGTGNASVNGGSTAYSSANIDVYISVTAANDAPVVDLNGPAGGVDVTTPVNYPEGFGAQAVLIAGVSVSDPDSTLLTGGTITLQNHPDGTDESIAVNTTGLSITATPDANSWVITLSGTYSLAEYQQLLTTLTYTNASDTPDDSVNRSIVVVLTDGTTPSAPATGLVQIQSINDEPVLTLGGATTLALGATLQLYDADGSGATATATIDGLGQVDTVTVTAPGSGFVLPPRVTFSGGGGVGAIATPSLSSGSVSGIAVADGGAGYTSAPTVTISPASLILSVTDADDPLTNLTYTVRLRPNLGDLTLNGSPLANNDTFTVADVVAGNVAYVHGGLLAGADGFAIEVDDGNGGSDVAIITLTITGLVPPQVLINDTTPGTWTEGDAPKQLDGSASVIDTDSANFGGGSITVAVTGGRTGDVLAFDPSLVGGSVVLSGSSLEYDADPGPGVNMVQLGTISGGADGNPLVIGLTANCTPGRAQTIIRGLTWTNTGDNPGVDPDATENRVFTFTINDGSNNGPSDDRTITVDPVDDPPVISAYTVALTPGLTVPGQLVATDPEGESLVFSLSAPLAGNGLVVMAADGSFTYEHQILDQITDTFGVTVQEAGPGQSTSGTVDVEVTVPDATAPRITSVAPARAEAGILFSYTPTLAGFGADVEYVLIPALTESFSGTAVNPADYTFSGGSSIDDGATGNLRITSPVAPPGGGAYYHTGILVIDRATNRSAYQPILIKIFAGFSG